MVTGCDQTVLGSRRQPALRWLGPLPIWARPGPLGLRLSDAAGSGRPAILRFNHDDFMQEYFDTLQRHPERLAEWLARPETWRRPMSAPGREAGPPAAATDEAGQVDFLYRATHREAAGKRRRQRPAAINLQALKGRLRRPPPTDSVSGLPLKLYQSAQKRHYLLCASLVEDAPGLPDCVPDLRRGEQASFVVRRLLPPEESATAPLSAWDEYAFVPGEAGNRWLRVAAHGSEQARRLASGEEQLPMFATVFSGDCEDSRRLFCGSIPVSRREQWMGASLGEADDDRGTTGQPADPTASHAALLLQADVVTPWKLLLEQADRQGRAASQALDAFDGEADGAQRRRLLRTARDQLQSGSWYVLLDLARFLRERLPRLWDALGGALAGEELSGEEQRVVEALRGAQLGWPLVDEIVTQRDFSWPPMPGPGDDGQGATDTRYTYLHTHRNLAEALRAALAAEEGLESVETAFRRYDPDGGLAAIDPRWPGFLFPLADPQESPPLPAVPAAMLPSADELTRRQAAVDALGDLITALLPAEEDQGLMDTAPLGDDGEAWFVLRCVYRRPRCGPLFPPLVSAATERFQMAAFFDPDAPSRPVRIPMPLDISPAGLRKYQKNTGFVVSDMLCGKLKGIRRMSLGDLVLSVLPWPLHRDLPEPADKPCRDGEGNGLGMICSLSIPIVTLCALILMMIMVALFDVIFRWIPWLFQCFPVPGLKGKKGGN